MTDLRRAVGLRTVVSTGAGMALATVSYIALIEVASYLTGHSAWIAILTAGIMAVLSGSCFAELNSMHPTAAGIKLYIQKAFNERLAVIIAGVYVIGQMTIIGAEIYVLSQGLTQGFPGVPPGLFAALFIAAVCYLNFRGIRIAGLTQDILSYTMFICLIVVSLYGLYTVDFKIPEPFAIGSFDGFIQAVAIGIASYIAFEWVITISEEVTDVRMVPKGMIISLGVLAIVYSLFAMAMTSVLDKQTLTWVLDPHGLPIPHILYGKKLLGTFGLYFMIAMAMLASLSSMNAGILTASRFVYAMARDWSLPRALSALHPVYATPWAAMIVVTVYAIICILYGFLTHYILSMILIISVAECMIYVIMALCVLRLRQKEPDAERSFRIRGGPLVPILVIIIYGVVGGFILFGPVKPDDRIEQRICQIFLAGLFVLNTLYAYTLWPRLRAKYQKMAQARTPRRRRRPQTKTVTEGEKD